MGKTVFASLVSQHENLGDYLIRSNALATCFPDVPVTALTSGMPGSYIRSFDLPTGSVHVESSLKFQLMLLKSIQQRSADLLLAPGPIVLSGSPRRLLKSAILTINCVLVRLSGGQVWSVGRSYRGGNFVARFLERLQSAAASKYYVRDVESQAVVGKNAVVKPDMAFSGAPISEQTPRRYIAISLRSYTESTFSQLQKLHSLAQSNGLDLVLVTQVRFDEKVHEKLALQLGCAHLAWGSRSHEEQLEEVCRVYAQSVAVVSNRLHSLILGLRCGAVAIACEPSNNPKLKSTLKDRAPVEELANIVSAPRYFMQVMNEAQKQSYNCWVVARHELLSFLSS